MTIALDATPLTVPTGGIRRYTEALAHALAANFPQDAFHLISDQPFALCSFHSPPPRNLFSHTVAARRWWSLQLPRTLKQLNCNLFHGTDFAVPYLPTRPSVLTLHDLSPWRFAPLQPQTSRVRRRTPLLLRSGIATMVITPSQAIRREAVAYFGLNPARVAAIPLAASETFRPVRVAPPPTPYFLFVGTLDARKNIVRMLEAWRAVRKESSVELWIAGREQPVAEPGLRYLGIVSDEALPALYSGATACLYPSLYEGFGLPVLEAMQCGALVITARDPAILEITEGRAAIHVNAEDTLALAQALRSALINGNHRDLRESAVRRARDFNWNSTARRTREVYDEAIRVFSGA